MTNLTKVFKNGKVIGEARSWKQATALLGAPAKYAKRDCGWCWTDR